MQAIKNGIDTCLRFICVALFVFITCVGAYQIVTRYVFNRPSTISEELLTYSFTWMALLSATYVFGKRDHMRMEFFARKFKGRSAVILSIVSECAVLLFAAGVLVYGGIAITRLTVMQVTASLGIPMAYVYAIVPVCGVLTVIYNIINIGGLAARLGSGDYSEERGRSA